MKISPVFSPLPVLKCISDLHKTRIIKKRKRKKKMRSPQERHEIAGKKEPKASKKKEGKNQRVIQYNTQYNAGEGNDIKVAGDGPFEGFGDIEFRNSVIYAYFS